MLAMFEVVKYERERVKWEGEKLPGTSHSGECSCLIQADVTWDVNRRVVFAKTREVLNT